MVATYHVDVAVAVGAFKHSGNQVVAEGQAGPADGASPRHGMFKTAKTAAYVHQAVFAAIQGRESQGFYQIASFHSYGADWANLRIAGFSLEIYFLFPRKHAGIKGRERAKK